MSTAPARDAILIEGLELSAHIGVPPGEREAPQRLTVNLRLEPRGGLPGEGDDISSTVDYFSVSRQVQALARARPRCLIETLAREICEHLLTAHPLSAVEIELRKYILPDTAHVAVRMRREG
jgi:dihydroneopterin aldolase